MNLRDLQPRCPISWAPSVLDPVFYGFKAYADPGVAVFYPSLDGSPRDAAILLNCERFPLVLFVHGDCVGDPAAQWSSLAGQLARCGYVVAVSSYGGVPASGDPAVTAPLRALIDWMRSTWEYRDRVMPAPHTAVAGHSRGGGLAAQLATEIPVMAFASLSGVLGDLPDPRGMLSRIAAPSLLLWNTVDDTSLGADASQGGVWSFFGAPKHAVVFFNANHGDYLMPGTACTQPSACPSEVCAQQSQCPDVRLIANDFVTTFMGKYLSPELAFTAFSWVPDSLFMKPPANPSAGGFYAGAFLEGFSGSQASGSEASPTGQPCYEQVRWETAGSTGSIFLKPV